MTAKRVRRDPWRKVGVAMKMSGPCSVCPPMPHEKRQELMRLASLCELILPTLRDIVDLADGSGLPTSITEDTVREVSCLFNDALEAAAK